MKDTDPNLTIRRLRHIIEHGHASFVERNLWRIIEKRRRKGQPIHHPNDKSPA